MNLDPISEKGMGFLLAKKDLQEYTKRRIRRG
jgi:hypothetical protein